MSQNPFESPQVADAYVAQPANTGGQIDIGQAISDGWAALTGNMGLSIGAFVVFILLTLVSYVTIVGIFLLIPVFGFGYMRLLLNQYEGRAEIGNLFDGFKEYGRALGSMLLWALIIVAATLPVYALVILGVVLESPVMMVIGQFLQLGIGIFVLIRLYFAPLFIVDQGMPAMEAVRAAWEATADQKLMTVVLALVAYIIVLAGVLLLGVGMLISAPFGYLVWVAGYRQLVGPSEL